MEMSNGTRACKRLLYAKPQVRSFGYRYSSTTSGCLRTPREYFTRVARVLSITALALSPRLAAAQIVSGVVRDTLGKRLEGVLVTLVDSTRRIAGAVRSNGAGEYRLRAPEHAYYASWYQLT